MLVFLIFDEVVLVSNSFATAVQVEIIFFILLMQQQLPLLIRIIFILLVGIDTDIDLCFIIFLVFSFFVSFYSNDDVSTVRMTIVVDSDNDAASTAASIIAIVL